MHQVHYLFACAFGFFFVIISTIFNILSKMSPYFDFEHFFGSIVSALSHHETEEISLFEGPFTQG